jgi:hypothetical protein
MLLGILPARNFKVRATFVVILVPFAHVISMFILHTNIERRIGYEDTALKTN